MSGHLIGCVKNMTASDDDAVHFGKSHKLAMVAFADSADDQTHIGFPGYKGVMAWAACSRSRAAELVTDLQTLGYLRLHRSARPGKNAEYVVFPNGCCDTHRRPEPDGRDAGEQTVEQLLASLEAAGVALTDAQRLLLDATGKNGSETPDTSPRNASENLDPSQAQESIGSEISDPMGQRVQNESEISEYSTTTTTPPSPRKRGATAAGATCQRPGEKPHPNCRGCGTTTRQIAEQQRRERAEQQRRADAERFAKQGGALTRLPEAVDTSAESGRQRVAAVRAAMAAATGGAR